MKTTSFCALVASAMLVAASALADDKAACVEAASKGQRFRDAHQLVEAREQLRRCASDRCPAVVQSDCASWLADVERALPTVVPAAKNPAGADVVDVTVTVDGQPLATKLDGQAVPMNAGSHAFHFAGADGATLDRTVLVREGEKNQPVAVVLGAALAPAPISPTSPTSPSAAQSDDAKPSNAWRTAGWVLGGAGGVGLGVGAVFGIVALSDKSAAHCVNDVCDAGKVSGIKTAALVSDVGWVAGGVLLASGAALLLFAPSGGTAGRTGAAVVPVVTAGGGGLMAAGCW